MIGSDIRYAWRSLNHQRFGSVLVIGMLALGIGSTVAVFSLVNGLFLRPFPFPEPERLVYINEAAPKWNLDMTGINYHDYAQWRRDQKVFDGDRALRRARVQSRDRPGRGPHAGRRGDDGLHARLGMQPVIGRMFTQEEDSPNGPLVTLIGEAVWQERFNGRADVLGKSSSSTAASFTIVGVVPKAANFPAGAIVGADAGRPRCQRPLQLRTASRG